MVLDQYVRDFKAFMEAFAAALESDRTKIYLDTSLLIWLIRLGGSARAEVLAWLRSRPTGAVKIPVWAGHELHRHILADTARKNLTDAVSDLNKKYDHFARIAAERADDDVCLTKGYPDRAVFITELEITSAKLERLSKVVILDDRPLQTATKEVIDFANEHMLSTDLAPIIKEVDRTGRFRVTHLMPPGFHDREEENTYGDLVIWEEMIRDLRRDEAGRHGDVVFISRDKKTDWVSAAPYVLNLRGETQKSNRDEELDVTEPHPLLVHELVETAGQRRLYIAQPSFLASVIDCGFRRRDTPTKVAAWLSASHKPDVLPKLASCALQPERPAASAAITVPPYPTVNAIVVQSQGTALPDNPKQFVVSCRAECIAYQKAPPGEQETLINDWVTGVVNASFAPVKLGSILAELVLAHLPGVQERIPAMFEILARLVEVGSLNEIALATITPAYFDTYGELRSTPDLSLGSVALSLEKQDQLQSAFKALYNFLSIAGAELPYVPGAGTTRKRQPCVLKPDSESRPKNLDSRWFRQSRDKFLRSRNVLRTFPGIEIAVKKWRLIAKDTAATHGPTRGNDRPSSAASQYAEPKLLCPAERSSARIEAA